MRRGEFVVRRMRQRRVELPAKTGRCVYCNRRGLLHLEHVEPLSRGGEHTPDNLAWACRACNLAKGDCFILEWVWRIRPHRRGLKWRRGVAREPWERSR